MHDVLAHSLSGLIINQEGARLMADRTGTDPQVIDAATAQAMGSRGCASGSNCSVERLNPGPPSTGSGLPFASRRE